MAKPTNATPQLDLHKELHNAVSNVKMFGAVGNGSADDTAAIQAAIDDAVGGAMSGTTPTPTRQGLNGTGSVYLPQGIYKITAPLVIRGIQGLRFWGAGSAATFIRVSGTLTQAIQMLGANTLDMRGFRIDGAGGYAGTGHVTSAITWDWTAAETVTSSYRSTFKDIWIVDLDFKYGWAIGKLSGNADVSNGRWEHCQVGGNFVPGDATTTQWQAGFYLGNGTAGNVLDFYFHACQVWSQRYGYYIDNVANVAVTNGSASNIETFVYKVGPGEVLLRDMRLEDGWRLAESGGGAAWSSHLSVRGLNWAQTLHSASDGRIIKWQYPGTVEVANSTFNYDGFAGTILKIYCNVNPGNGRINVSLRNVSLYSNNAPNGPQQHLEVTASTVVRAAFEGVTTTTNTGSWNATHPFTVITWNTNNDVNVGDTRATGETGTDQTSFVRIAHAGDATGGGAAFAWTDGTSDKWWFYKVASSDILFLRDQINARMHATYTPGNSVTAAITELNSELKLLGPLNHDGTTVGFYGHTPSAQPAAYTVTNPTTDRGLNVTADTLAQVAQVLGTLIADLQTQGLIG